MRSRISSLVIIFLKSFLMVGATEIVVPTIGINDSIVQTGGLDIASFPDSVNIVYENNEYKSVFHEEVLPVGEHKFTFYRNGYLPLDTIFAVKRDKMSFYTVVMSPARKVSILHKKEKQRKKQTLDILLMAQGGYDDELSLGLMFGLIKTNGFYVKGMTTISFPKIDYVCNRGGVIGGINYPYYKESTYSNPCFSASGGYMRRLWKWLIVYAGTGYGKHKVIWETIDGKTVENYGLTTSGLVAEGGVILHLKSFSISCGVQSIDFSHTEIQFGVGLIF